MSKFLLTVISFCFVSGFGLVSCSGSKEGREVSFPCTGTKFQSDNRMFRGTGTGLDYQDNLAKRIALVTARENLAREVKTMIQGVTETYQARMEANRNADSKAHFQNMVYDITRETLVGSAMICEKVVQLKSGEYKYYVAVEMDKETFLNGLMNNLPAGKKKEIEMDEDRFREIFREKMNEYGSGNKR